MYYTIIFLLGLGMFSSYCHCQQSPLPRYLGEVEIPFAAYLEILMDQGDEATPIADRYTLYVSTFNAYSALPDPKFLIRSVGRNLNNVSLWNIEEIDRNAQWPNNPDPVPEHVFGGGAMGVIWTSGFLVPFKTRGRLQLYDTTQDPPAGPWNVAASDTSDWSYHRVEWKDIDADGDLDALTARFYVPIFGGEILKELLWFENPGLPMSETPGTGWTQHTLLTNHTDVHFRIFNFTFSGVPHECIISSEFFNEQLVLFCTTAMWTDWSQVKEVVLDTELGQAFDVYVDDFNRDGRLDILVTAYNFTFGNVFMYELPDQFDGEYSKYTVADGFIANDIEGGQSMTPGSPKPFYPSKEYENEELPDGRQRKPYILLSGDDDGKHYVLEPVSEDPLDWRYHKHLLVDTEETTSGKCVAQDLDGDGYTEIIAAGYSSNTLYVYTYAPEEE